MILKTYAILTFLFHPHRRDLCLKLAEKDEKQNIIRSDNITHIFNYLSSIIRFAKNSDTDIIIIMREW